MSNEDVFPYLSELMDLIYIGGIIWKSNIRNLDMTTAELYNVPNLVL